MKNTKVIIATHKKYKMPNDEMYVPVQVGREGKEDLGYQPDNEGENISSKNPYFCELTGLYWAWKNLNADSIGVKNVITGKEVDEILDSTDIILPKKRKYYIENLYSHYNHTMYIEPLDETRKIIEEKFPSYLSEFNKLHKRTSAHMFNMFIMKKEIFDAYCTWLFDILFDLENRVDVAKYDSFHSRFFGRVSELLLDVWINTNNLNYKEVKVIDIEKVNWFKKGFAFLLAKFTGKKYGKSF